MKPLLVIAVCLASGGCATAIHERRNPAGGAPLTSFWTSSNAEEIEFTSASGARFVVRKLDNSTGPKEAIRVWSIFDLWLNISGLLGGLAGKAL